MYCLSRTIFLINWKFVFWQRNDFLFVGVWRFWCIIEWNSFRKYPKTWEIVISYFLIKNEKYLLMPSKRYYNTPNSNRLQFMKTDFCLDNKNAIKIVRNSYIFTTMTQVIKKRELKQAIIIFWTRFYNVTLIK